MLILMETLPIGTIVGGDDMQPSTTVEPPRSSKQAPLDLADLIIWYYTPKSLTVIKENKVIRDRGLLGSQGDPGRTGSDIQPKGGEQEPPKPQGFMRSMAGMVIS